jgi:hypothetical protein
VRYQVRIEIPYLSSDPDFAHSARHTLLTAILANLSESDTEIVLLNLVIEVESDRTMIIDATLQGVSRAHLTSPLDAIARLDSSLSRALIFTGMYEEFDVSRRVLHVDAGPGGPVVLRRSQADDLADLLERIETWMRARDDVSTRQGAELIDLLHAGATVLRRRIARST